MLFIILFFYVSGFFATFIYLSSLQKNMKNPMTLKRIFGISLLTWFGFLFALIISHIMRKLNDGDHK